MFNLSVKARKLSLPVDVQCELFDLLVSPILTYGCEVWGFCNLSAIDLFHRKYLKYLLKLNKSTSNCMVYGETGRVKLEVMVKKRMIGYWSRLCQGKESKLSTIIYKLLKNQHDNNKHKSPCLDNKNKEYARRVWNEQPVGWSM